MAMDRGRLLALTPTLSQGEREPYLDIRSASKISAQRPPMSHRVRCRATGAILRPFSAFHRSIVGFLDDLKRQAEALKAQQTDDTAALARHAALTEAACQAVFTYFTTLATQLDVLGPTSPRRFALDRQNVLDGLRMTDFRADSRRKPLRDEPVFDYLVLHWQLRSGRALQLTKDFLPDMERIESRLRQGGGTFDNEALRNPDNGKLLGRRYTFVADFVGSVRATAVHDRARVHFQLHNLDGFESVSLELPATEVGSARLDELARWILGQPHRFLDGAEQLRRTEA
jgi:hypothetical protein